MDHAAEYVTPRAAASQSQKGKWLTIVVISKDERWYNGNIKNLLFLNPTVWRHLLKLSTKSHGILRCTDYKSCIGMVRLYDTMLARRPYGKACCTRTYIASQHRRYWPTYGPERTGRASGLLRQR